MKFNPIANAVKVALIASILYVLVTFGICGAIATSYAESYPLTTVVVSVDYDHDEVVCLDFNQNEWIFEGCEDWEVFDICSMIMDDNDTDLIYDDAIICVRCDGWLEGWEGTLNL